MNYRISKTLTPKGQARYELRLWAKGRNQKQQKRRFKNRHEAVNYVDKLLREDKRKTLGEFLSRTFGEEYEYWRKENPQFAPGWKANLEGYWNETKEFLNLTDLSSLDKKISDLKGKWNEAGNSVKTINNKMGFIHAVLNFSVEKKRISHNPLGVFKRTKSQDPDIAFWERKDAESFLIFLDQQFPKESKSRWKYAAVYTALNTGLRAGEVWGLKHGDLKPELGSIRVTRQFNRVSKKFTQLKGKAARSVPLGPDLLDELKYSGVKSSDLVFSNDGTPIDHDNFAATFDTWIIKWGGRVITFHGLRHTAATLMLLAGADVKSVQTIMGHKDISTTMKYVHAIGDSAKKVGQIFSIGPQEQRPCD